VVVVRVDPGVRRDLAVLSQLNHVNRRRVARFHIGVSRRLRTCQSGMLAGFAATAFDCNQPFPRAFSAYLRGP
jgi:hypothetical protein